MSPDPINVLLVEDNPDQAELIERALTRQPGEIALVRVADGPGCLEALPGKEYSVVLLDYSLPGMDGLSVLREIRRRGSRAPVIMVTGQGDERVAVEAMKEGAADYLIKAGGYLTTLPTVVSKVLKQHELQMENLRLLEETRARAEEQAALNYIATAISQSLEVEELLEIALEKVLRVTGRERGHIRLKSPRTGELELVAWKNVPPEVVETLRQSPAWGRSAEAIGSREACVIDHPLELIVSRFPHLDHDLLVALIPLKARGGVIGLLTILTPRRNPFSSRDVDLFQSIGSLIGVAVENARLYEETRQRAQEQEALNTIATAVSQSLAVEELLKLALDKVLEVTGRERGYIYLQDGETGMRKMMAHREVSAPVLQAILTRQGRISRVFATGLPVLINDPSDERLWDVTKAEGVQAVALIPIKAKGKVAGILGVSTRRPRRFSEEEVELLAAIGNVIGVALDNARLFEETERRRLEAESLAEVGRVISQSLDPENVQQRIVESVHALFRAQSSTLLSVDPSSGNLTTLAFCGGPAPTFGKEAYLPKGQGIAGLAVEERRAVSSLDTLSDPRIALTPDLRAKFEATPPRAALSAPLIAKGRVIGALVLLDLPGRVFGPEDLQMAQAFADQAALALENAHLFVETERRRREAEELARVARTLTESLDVEAVSGRIVEGVQRFLGVESSVVCRLQADRSLIALAAAGRIREIYQAGLVLPPGSGLVGRAATTGNAVISTDIMNDPEVVLTEAHHQIAPVGSRSVVAVPLRSKGETIGALGAADHVGRRFTEAEVSLLQTFADQAALVLENARLYEETVERRRQAEELSRISRTLTESLDVDAVARRIAESVQQFFGAGFSTVWKLLPDGSFVSLASAGVARELHPPGLVVLPGHGVSSRAVRENGPVYLPDVLSEPDAVVLTESMRRLADAGCRAVLAVPLRAKGEVIGALSIGDKIGRVFSDAEMMLLQTFADQAALALENARLFLDAKLSYEELKRTQEQMIHVEKLRALGEMAGGVAHDFNNLLAAILGRAQYALLTLGDLSEHDLRRSLGVIERAALDGAETVRRLLDFTRGKARQQEWSQVDVSDLLTYVVEASRPRWKDEAEAKGITIQMQCLPGDVPCIAGNPVELREVLLNLVFNAIEAMPQGGIITLRSFMEGGKVSIELRDTGLGMPPEVRRRIFDPFFTTKGPQRSGLGLSVSYGIIRRHDGEIDVESGEGKGTTFTIRLPVRDAPPPPELRVVEAFTSKAYRVLVVDDDEAVRDMLNDILRVAGHEVSLVEDGYQALELLRERPFDFVCTDLGMPGMNGWELVQRIKAGWPGVKIALITGWGVQIEPEEAMANGVDLLISKPFEVQEILRALAESAGPASVKGTGAR